ncbi:MAG: PEP-CTERM sorting domain-containing protein [Opitutaceae bacterium]|nr:PEP-CTERM sorting domain-containing protein [Cephaloticoccus sp.]MCP5530579.1 PEP-CTERM sorting domain-containing protein [Opitutaceae bacterium]
MRFVRVFWISLLGAVLSTGAVGQVSDPNIAQYGVGKAHRYTQTGPSTVTATSYAFNAFVDATANGVINAAKLYGPLNSYLDANGPQDLTVRGDNSGADFTVTGYVDTNDLNAAFPNDSSGNYRLRIDTGSAGGSIGGTYDHEIQFNLGGDAYPATIPLLTIDNGAWNSGTYMVGAPDAVTHFGWNFSDYNSTTDVVVFSIRANNDGTEIARVQFQGSNPGGYTLAADALLAGVDYTGELFFARIVDNPSDISGVQGVAYYSVETTFAIQAVPEPSTYVLMGVGALMIWWWRRRAARPRA